MTERKQASLSRRTIVGGIAVGTIAAIVAVNGNGGVGGPGSLVDAVLGGGAAPQAPLARAEMAEWQGVVGATFDIAGTTTARLVGVQPLNSQGARPRGLRRRAFMAVFELPGEALPGDLIYTLTSATHGRMDLFLSTGRAANRLFAVFN